MHSQAQSEYQDTIVTRLKLACMNLGSKSPSVLSRLSQAVCLHSRIHRVTSHCEQAPIHFTVRTEGLSCETTELAMALAFSLTAFATLLMPSAALYTIICSLFVT